MRRGLSERRGRTQRRYGGAGAACGPGGGAGAAGGLGGGAGGARRPWRGAAHHLAGEQSGLVAHAILRHHLLQPGAVPRQLARRLARVRRASRREEAPVVLHRHGLRRLWQLHQIVKPAQAAPCLSGSSAARGGRRGRAWPHGPRSTATVRAQRWACAPARPACPCSEGTWRSGAGGAAALAPRSSGSPPPWQQQSSRRRRRVRGGKCDPGSSRGRSTHRDASSASLRQLGWKMP